MTIESTMIRPLGYTDLPQMVGIERRAFATPWSVGMFVLELSKGSGVCLAASQGGRLRGYLVCSHHDDLWHLMNLAVDPPARRRGLARAMLEALLERAGSVEPVALEVRPSNAPAIALYASLGFRPGGTRPGYYQDTGEDAMLMWRPGERSRHTGAPVFPEAPQPARPAPGPTGTELPSGPRATG